MISIVIPAYNTEAYITRCLDSICEQNYSDFEAIVVDDGSSDNTSEICDRYAQKDKGIKVIHKKNEGVAAARNIALDEAKGDAVAFLDSDDYYEPDMLRNVWNAMISNDADMVVCGYYEEYPGATEIRKPEKETSVLDKCEAYEEYFKVGGCIGSGCWNKLIKASVIKNIRFKRYSIGEDVEMLCRTIGLCNRVICIDYIGYHYIHREDSASMMQFRSENMESVYTADEVVKYIKRNNPDLTKQAYSFHAYWMVSTIQIMKKSGKMHSFKKECREIKEILKKNKYNYLKNPYVYSVHKVLLISFSIGLFVPVQSMYELISSIHRGRLR